MRKRKHRAGKRTESKIFTRGRILKGTAVLLLIPSIVVCVYLVRYYYIFEAEIEAKLGRDYDIAETEIYAAPRVLRPGKTMPAPELLATLRRLGYVEEGSESPDSSFYRVEEENRILIHNGPELPRDAGLTFEVRYTGDKIRSLAQGGAGHEIAAAALQPELLSNVIGKSREKRRFVPYSALPKVLVDAVLASEDRRFFSHSGIDPIRILKALIVDIRAGDTVQGASTLTQQFVKNYFLTPERTWRRKLTDIYMSILLEQRLTKEQILELYTNEVYLGQRGSFGIVGFGEAAEAYFGRNVRNLELGEAATLAGIISAPNRYSPLRYPKKAETRRNLVLDEMADYGMITADECLAAKAAPLEVKPSTVLNYSDAPYFIDYLQDVLTDQFDDLPFSRSRYTVYTTLDTDLQKAAYESIREQIDALDEHFAGGKRAIPPGTVQASLIAVDPRTGRILAMVGGRNYAASQYNRITQSKRQPGSIFKPFVYAAALETAYTSPDPLTAASTVVDGPTEFQFEDLLYGPKNFEEEYLGQVTMRQAIMHSLNIATIKFAEKTGYDKVAEMARRLGLEELIRPYPAMAIGAFEVSPLEMARAYTAFANGGVLSQLSSVYRICDEGNHPVFVGTAKSEQVLTPQIAFMVTSLLQSVINQGTGAGARSRGFMLPAAGKTGTSRDGWFAGYTPDLLCIVWVGFDDNRELNIQGSRSALPIWTSFMKKAAKIIPLSGAGFPMPDGIVQVEIDPTTGMLATDHCLERFREYYIKGTEPLLPCNGNPYERMFGETPASGRPPTNEPTAGADNVSTPPGQ